MTVVSRWLIGAAFAAPTSVRFGLVLFPVPAHRTGLADFPHRLSEKTHAFAHGRFAVRCGNWTKPYTEFRDASGKRLYANQFPGGSCTRCSPAPFTAHCY